MAIALGAIVPGRDTTKMIDHIRIACLLGRKSCDFAHMRAVLKPQSSVLIIAERGEVKVVKSCARARSASAAQGTRKVTVLKGFMY